MTKQDHFHNKQLVEILEKDMVLSGDSLSCHSLRVLLSEEDNDSSQVILEKQTVFGKEEISQTLKVSSLSEDELSLYRLKVISFEWKSVSGRENWFRIGFFESGEQLGWESEYYNGDEEKRKSKSLVESLQCFKKGSNIDLLHRYRPSVEFLLFLLERLKIHSKTLSNLQMETILTLFQQVTIKDLNEFRSIREKINCWMKLNENCLEQLFFNMNDNRWNNQSSSRAFFSLAFYDINRVTRRMLVPLIGYCRFHKYERFLNIILAANYGSELAIMELQDSRSLRDDQGYGDPEIVKLLNELEIKTVQSDCQPSDTFPYCLLERPSQYQHNMDPRSVCFLGPAQFKKSNLTELDFTKFLFGRDFYITYLHKKAIHFPNKMEIFQEIKTFDLSLYYYALAVANVDIGENAGLAVKHGLGYAYGLFNARCPHEEERKVMEKRMAYFKT